MWLDKSKSFVYPRLFSLHDMDADAGYPNDNVTDDTPEDSFAGRNFIMLPKVLPLTIDSLSSDGLYLVDNGVEFFIWVGREADQSLVNSLFGSPSLENVDPVQLTVQTDGDEFSSRVGSIMSALREDPADPFVIPAKTSIVREGDGHMEARFFWFLVEDRASFQGGTYSYEDFVLFVKNPGQGPGAPGAPPGMPPGAPGMPPGPMQGRGMPPGPPGAPGMPPGQMQGRGMPPGPPGQQSYGQPPMPPQQQQGYGQPPMPPQQQQGYGQPPTPQGPPPNMGARAPPGPPQNQYGQPPAPPAPQKTGPPPPGRAVNGSKPRPPPPPPPPGARPPPPPPPR